MGNKRTMKDDAQMMLKNAQSALERHPESDFFAMRVQELQESLLLYQCNELLPRPEVTYGDWRFIFEDDESAMQWIAEQCHVSELTIDDALYQFEIQYKPMTGVELGNLSVGEM